jgi:hypothetical protein
LVVKSVSSDEAAAGASPALLFSQVHDSTGRTPHGQVSPSGLAFSLGALLQLHSPAGRARHEQRGPVVLFSASAREQVQWSAGFSPHEHLACSAQTQLWPSFLQQVEGLSGMIVDV